jgi:small-conductance mechanosensitive channel
VPSITLAEPVTAIDGIGDPYHILMYLILLLFAEVGDWRCEICMKTIHRTVVIVVLSLAAAATVGIVLISHWVQVASEQGATKIKLTDRSSPVDEEPLATAQKLATLAVTKEEKDFAQEAVRVADRELDLTFVSALRDATLHPPPVTATAREILAHIQELQDRVKAEQADVARIKRLSTAAGETRKEALEQELQLEQALLEVDQEELDATRQELIRVGGDPQSFIQRLMEQHEAWNQRQRGAPAGLVSLESGVRTEEPESRSVIAQFRAWRRLSAKEAELTRAMEEVKVRAADLAERHRGLASQGGDTTGSQESGSSDLFSSLKRVAEEQKNLAELDKRVLDLQQLENIYGNWRVLVVAGRRASVKGLLESSLWILAGLLLVLLADWLARSVLSLLAPERKRLDTIRSVARFALQAIGVALILLVVFGPPNQLATVIALAGAGLTVALKNFIVGFFGWFALMGRNGIRPGDWVEINGVGGEVLEVGLLHTVLLETGNWSDAGHPTGRKVTLVNSFAIEGQYFNFSTSGQWLWDEIQVPVPPSVDPYPVAEAIQKVVADETLAHVRLAEHEWQRVVPAPAGRSFSAAPTVNVRATAVGVNVVVRYITRAPEQHEVRSRLYCEIVELLHSKRVPQTPPETETEKSLRAST